MFKRSIEKKLKFEFEKKNEMLKKGTMQFVCCQKKKILSVQKIFFQNTSIRHNIIIKLHKYKNK